MPATQRLPCQGYDTPNIRVGTHADFRHTRGKWYG